MTNDVDSPDQLIIRRRVSTLMRLALQIQSVLDETEGAIGDEVGVVAHEACDYVNNQYCQSEKG